MADGGDRRDFAGGDGAGQRLVVEGGEVLDAASAAGDEKRIPAETSPAALAPCTWAG
jgi:hypothetical protein